MISKHQKISKSIGGKSERFQGSIHTLCKFCKRYDRHTEIQPSFKKKKKKKYQIIQFMS